MKNGPGAQQLCPAPGPFYFRPAAGGDRPFKKKQAPASANACPYCAILR